MSPTEKKSELYKSSTRICGDVTTDAVGNFINTLIVGNLQSEAPSKPYLIYCKPLEATDDSKIQD